MRESSHMTGSCILQGWDQTFAIGGGAREEVKFLLENIEAMNGEQRCPELTPA